MTLRQALIFGTSALRPHACEGTDAIRDAEELLLRAARISRERLFIEPEQRLPWIQALRYRSLIRRRLRHEPLAYILGSAPFRGRDFIVTPSTLIPRPATETLVQAAIQNFATPRPLDPSTPRPLIFDVGAGSGCIAISMALECPEAEIIATDMSRAALRIAKRNAKRHGVGNRIRFLRTDLLDASPLHRFTASPLLIIANLPYVPSDMMKKLSPCVLREPRSALDGGQDGLDHYRKLLERLKAHELSPVRQFFFEILPGQQDPLRTEIERYFPEMKTTPIRNPAGVVIGIHSTT